ncbi:MAG TPA: GlxA family transcriptional regulator [Polyangia bacterium]|nr:GlxA family transcriptional regulator [Polyangia bacterium]
MHRVGLVLIGGFQIMSSAAVAVFEIANILGGKQFYDVSVISEGGGSVRSSIGMVVETQPLSGVFDTLLVAGGIVIEPTRPPILALLRRAVSRSRRVASICTGAFVLAEAGILDGRRATTHWLHARELQTRFPKVRVEDDRIFIKDGPVWTSAGMTAGIDLALAMVESDLGAEAAREVARGLVVYHRRGGGQSQFSTLLTLDPKSDPIQTALAYARQNLRTQLSVEALARVAHLSVRQFTRTFRTETGQSPAKAVESLRLEVARVMLEAGTYSIEEVAEETGFGDRERMRRAFVRAFGLPPQAIRMAQKVASTTFPPAANIRSLPTEDASTARPAGELDVIDRDREQDRQ